MSKNREIAYNSAIKEALTQIMEKDPSVLLMGQGVKSPWYTGGTCQGLIEKFGQERVIDTPVSENAMTGAAVGAALAGMRSIIMYPRMDFMLYAIDPIVNEAANWKYMLGDKADVPVVFWGIINRGGEQAAQHSQAFQALFAHIPGLKVVMPSNPYDAKGLLIASLYDGNPVVYITDRWLHDIKGEVPEEIYQVPIGKAEIKRDGKDITMVATSFMVQESLKAAEELGKSGIEAEVLDLRSIKPLDKDAILKSVKKTRKLVVADAAWKTYGVSAEIIALVSENIEAKVKRILYWERRNYKSS